MDFSNFTKAQELAWDWIRSAVEQGLRPTEALSMYRAEGGAIQRQAWFREYASVTSYSQQWEQISTFGAKETIPERMWGEAPRSFAQKYVAEVEISIRETESGALTRTFRYIESNYRMSKSEIDSAVNELGMNYVQDEQWTNEYTYGYKFYKSGAK